MGKKVKLKIKKYFGKTKKYLKIPLDKDLYTCYVTNKVSMSDELYIHPVAIWSNNRDIAYKILCFGKLGDYDSRIRPLHKVDPEDVREVLNDSEIIAEIIY